MINSIALTGRLTADAELRGSFDKPLLAFTLASDVWSKDGGETLFINCVLFGSRASKIKEYMTKGAKVGIVGELNPDNYETKDGGKRYGFKIIVRDVDFMSAKTAE